MSERKNLGEVLRGLGRVSAEDQERALGHQRTHGGYFGEALVALGIVSQEELDFGLAAQFDLPYVFPDPESIDLDAAEMVAPEWALAHLALPISRGGGKLSVVVDSPLKGPMVEELEARTGLEVHLSIASSARIRALIRHVFGGDANEEPGLLPAASLDSFLDEVLAQGSSRFGVSLRSRTILGWWEASGRVHRRHITSGWPSSLERRLSPSMSELSSQGADLLGWEARLAWGGAELPVVVRRVAAPAGEELLVELVETRGEAGPFDPPTGTLVDEVRLLVRSGAGRFLVSTFPSELAGEIVPHLPDLLLGAEVRTLHLSRGDSEAASGLSLVLPDDHEEAREFLAGLRPFRMEALTAEVPEGFEPLLPALARAAGAAFVAVPDGHQDPAFGWKLQIRRDDGNRLEWQLRPAASSATGA